jgi:hypothetical protein
MAGDFTLLEKANRWSISHDPSCANTSPNEMDEASKWMWNSLLQSGKTKIGAVTIFCFSVSKLC